MKIILKTKFIIFVGFYVLISTCVLIVSFSNVSSIHVPVFDNWWTIVDELRTGSSIKPDIHFVTPEGNIEVTMNKAADPEWNEQELSGKYPYVGIGVYFKPSGAPSNLSNVENIKLIYKLDGSVSLILSQPDIKPGDEFIFDLPQAEEYTELIIKWPDFYQPLWIKNKTVLDISKITGISFQIRTRHGSTANLGINAITLFKKPTQK